MRTFLQETIADIQSQQADFNQSIWVVPSKRAAGFIKNELRQQATKAQILPVIHSIEEFIQILSDLRIADPTQLVFETYKVYLSIESILVKEDFDTFNTWVTTLISDFNEIDRYRIDTTSFFDYLNDIQDLEHWSLAEEKTDLIQSYLSFWNNLPKIYAQLKEELLSKGIAHQGLVYRIASETSKEYLKNNPEKDFVFIGFNALNNAEQMLFQNFLEKDSTRVYWDMDTHFLSEPMHGASLFMQRYLETWPYFKKQKPLGIQDNFSKEKDIQLIPAPQNITQVKALASILEELTPEERRKTAIVLADESLLGMVLGSLPTCIEKVNITMGAGIEHFPDALFFVEYLQIQQKNQEAFYHKDIFTILQHPMVQASLDKADALIDAIKKENFAYCTTEKITKLYTGKDSSRLKLLFTPWQNDAQLGIQTCLDLAKEALVLAKDTGLERIVLYELFKLLEDIRKWMSLYPYVNTVKALGILFTEAIRTSSIDFEGDAYDGLQIMGVLESRVLDFENIILLSVNEGVLPSGKSNNSFITYDLKREYGLPLYTEKDAIYTYHFYRLLQRAKKIWLCYNTDDSGMKAGEPSRFIMQLEINGLPAHKLTTRTVSPKVTDSGKVTLETISKNDLVIQRLEQIAKKGFSPSTLGSYIRNPLTFYEERILNIYESDQVEETIENRTLGTIVHNTLEELYKQCNAVLDIQSLENIKKLVDKELEKQFKKSYLNGDYTQGFNLIIYNVAKKFVERAIQEDYNLLKNTNQDGSKNSIEIIKLEQELEAQLFIPSLNKHVTIKGLADRIDRFNGGLRIIDYKTGMVSTSNLSITDWEKLISDESKKAAFQVLAYAWMYMKNHAVDNLQAGILSMRNMNTGFMPVKENRGFKETITKEVVDKFEGYLVSLIEEIYNLEIDFQEKEV